MHSSPPRPRTHPRPVPCRLLLRVAASAAVLSLALLLLVAAEWQPLMDLDRAVVVPLHDVAVEDPGLTLANRILSDWVWDPWTMRVLLAVVVLWLLRQGAKWLALWVAATSAVGTLVQQSLKWAVGRERPRWSDPVDSAHFASCPSGHAMTATVSFGLLLWVLHRYGARPAWWRAGVALAVVSVTGVGVTRAYLGVHWPSDVVAGWLLGVLVVALSMAAYARRPGLAGSTA